MSESDLTILKMVIFGSIALVVVVLAASGILPWWTMTILAVIAINMSKSKKQVKKERLEAEKKMKEAQERREKEKAGILKKEPMSATTKRNIILSIGAIIFVVLFMPNVIGEAMVTMLVVVGVAIVGGMLMGLGDRKKKVTNK